MSNTLIFEQYHRGNSWRMEAGFYKGRQFINFRKWYKNSDGEWKPSPEGLTFPLERLDCLCEAIQAWQSERTHNSIEVA